MEDEKLDKIDYRKNWKKCLELYYMKGFGMLAFCAQKGIDMEEFMEFQAETTLGLRFSKALGSLATVMGQGLPKKMLLKLLAKRIVKNLKSVQNTRDFTLELDDNRATIQLRTCQARISIRKHAKKMKIQVPDDANCMYCKKTFSRADDLGFQTVINPTKDGCNIQLQII